MNPSWPATGMGQQHEQNERGDSKNDRYTASVNSMVELFASRTLSLDGQVMTREVEMAEGNDVAPRSASDWRPHLCSPRSEIPTRCGYRYRSRGGWRGYKMLSIADNLANYGQTTKPKAERIYFSQVQKSRPVRNRGRSKSKTKGRAQVHEKPRDKLVCCGCGKEHAVGGDGASTCNWCEHMLCPRCMPVESDETMDDLGLDFELWGLGDNQRRGGGKDDGAGGAGTGMDVEMDVGA